MNEYPKRAQFYQGSLRIVFSLPMKFALMPVFIGLLCFANVADAAIYYVDSLSGNNAYAGTSEAAAWRTVSRVNLQHFSPGDELLFRRGCEWIDVNVRVTTSSFKIGAYGVGTAPRLLGSIPVADWKKKQMEFFSSFSPTDQPQRLG